MSSDARGTAIAVGATYVVAGSVRVDPASGRLVLVLGTDRALELAAADVLPVAELVELLDLGAPVEHVLSGTSSGSTTSIDLVLPGPITLGAGGGIPVARALYAEAIAVALRHGTPGAGTWTATLHRIRSGGDSAVASFTFDV